MSEGTNRISHEEEQAILEELDNGMLDEVVANESDDEKAAKLEAEKQKAAEGKDGGEGAASSPEQVQVVKTRDEKHEIPYSVLEAERKKARELQRQLDEKNQQLDAAIKANSEKALEKNAVDDSVDLKALADDFGIESDIYKMAVKQNELLKKIAQQDEAFKIASDREAKRHADEAGKQQQLVDEAIDSVPMLSNWKNNPDSEALWSDAVAMDERLRSNPAYANVSMKDRFEKVVELVAQMNGINLPAKPLPKEVQKSNAEVLPNSLTEIIGGAAVDQSAIERDQRMSVIEMESAMETMSPEALEAYLAKI